MNTLLLATALMLAMPSFAVAAGPADEKAVMATLEDMATATIEKNVAPLTRIYADEVTYSHSSGAVETKAQVLAGIKGAHVAGTYMKFKDTTIRFYGDVAVVRGAVDYRSASTGRLMDNNLNILWVLVRRAEGPHGWQIVARQTTRVGASTGTPVAQ